LKLQSPLTLEFRDDFYGRCCAFFTASDIVSITRQGDRNGIFIQLSRPLRLDVNKEHSITTAMFLFLQFYEETNLSIIFGYLTSNTEMNRHLRVVYDSWMLCSKYSTNMDVYSMNDKNSMFPKVKYATRVKNMQSEKSFKWAKHLNDSEVKETVQETGSSGLLPPSFRFISPDLGDYILTLLRDEKLKPYQITVGFCGTLSIATSVESKLRARIVLLEMTKNNDVQLKNLHCVARFILGSGKETEIGQKTLKRQEMFQQTGVKKDVKQDCRIL